MLPQNMTPALVIGLGNPLLGDDGVGWRIAERVQQEAEGMAVAVEVDFVSLGGLALMERLVGYEWAVLIDAITTGQAPAGTVHQFPLEALPDLAAGHIGSAHDTSLQTALSVGRALGAVLPEHITIVAVETNPVFEFGLDLTPAVARAVPEAARLVLDSLCKICQEE